MDFEQYLEQDILKFLDSKMEKNDRDSIDREEEYGLYLTRDYLKELTYVLDNDELTKAKKLFDELKRIYVKLPASSFEKKKVYKILEKMYNKIQNYVEIKEGKVEVIKEGQSEIQKDKKAKFSNTVRKAPEAEKQTTETEWDLTRLKSTALPIHIGVKGGDFGDDKSISKDKSVESNILGMSMKDELDKSKNVNEGKSDIGGTSKTDGLAGTGGTKRSSNIGNISIDLPSEISQIYVDERKLGPLEEDIIEKEASLERMKMRVIEKLISDLRSKIEEHNEAQRNKIDSLRDEIIQQLNMELEKRSDKSKSEPNLNTKSIRHEILDKVYDQAGEMVSSLDTEDRYFVARSVSEEKDDNDVKDINYNNDITYNKDVFDKKIGDELRIRSVKDVRFSSEELRVVYEQAIYSMFNNNYDEAAKILTKIIAVQPNNKAARIRLQECIEKHPELLERYSKFNDSVIYASDKQGKSAGHKKKYLGLPAFGIANLEVAMKSDSIIGEDLEDEETYKSKLEDKMAKSGDEELKKMYEQAIYEMFQDNYNEAADIFRNILKTRPSDMIAKMRLKECIEAMHNA